MRKILLSIFILFSNVSFTQSGDEKVRDPFAVEPVEFYKLTPQDLVSTISDSTTYVTLRNDVLIDGSTYRDAHIAFRRYGAWFSFALNFDPKSVRTEKKDINNDNIEELVVYGSRDDYGSGGGTSGTGVTIYKIDTAVTRLFDLVYSFSEESFGRSGPGYIHTCEREVAVGYNQVTISPITTTKHKRKGGMEYEDICGSTDEVKPGIYTWQNGKLTWTKNYKK